MVKVILRLIFYALLFGAIYYAVRGLFGGARATRRGAREEAGEHSSDAMIACPECGTYFPMGIGVSSRMRGKKYLFCAEECAQSFRSRGGPPQDDSVPDQGEG